MLCKRHNLPTDTACLAEKCHSRLSCQVCIKSHDHKFYLDDRLHDKRIAQIKKEISSKLEYVKTYRKSNISNLGLEEYKQKLLKHFEDQELYLNSRVLQQTMNFNLQMEKSKKHIQRVIDDYRSHLLAKWEECNGEATRQADCDEELSRMNSLFQGANESDNAEIERIIKFLYSEELLFKFNKDLDELKEKISHYRKQDDKIKDWLANAEVKSRKIQLCDREEFRLWRELFESPPEYKQYVVQSEGNKNKDLAALLVQEILNSGGAKTERQLLQIKLKYENFHHIQRLARYDNQKFVSAGGRSINLWNRFSLSPDKVYPLDYPSYGLTRFKEESSAVRIIFGMSNGELGMLNPTNDKIFKRQGHESCIREILQFDSTHFVTASQDWTMKVWAVTDTNSQEWCDLMQTLKAHSGKIYALSKFALNVLSAGADGTIKLWDIVRGQYDEVFPQEKEVYCLKELREEYFASSGEIKEIRLWDYRKTKVPMIKHGLNNPCHSMLRLDENRMAVSDKNVIRVLDFRSLKDSVEVFKEQRVYDHAIQHMEFLSDTEIGMGGSDNFVTLWKY